MPETEQLESILRETESLVHSPLYQYRKENGYLPVVGEGDPKARIMFVGEAPGRNEAQTGRPFCGAAGKILDKLLLNAGIERSTVYITNIVKDRPPENRDPTAEEIRVYGPLLDKQIDIIKPKVIATLGRYAMGYILQRFGVFKEDELRKLKISSAHGKTFKGKTKYGEIDIAVLYHPCVAVYNPNNLNSLLEEFKILQNFNHEKI